MFADTKWHLDVPSLEIERKLTFVFLKSRGVTAERPGRFQRPAALSGYEVFRKI
jgi:hypothetical protein